jgi:hypothetical protein
VARWGCDTSVAVWARLALQLQLYSVVANILKLRTYRCDIGQRVPHVTPCMSQDQPTEHQFY